MFRNKTGLNVARRVIVYHLLFGLAAVVWLAVAVAFVARTVHESQTENQCIARLGEAAREIRATGVRKEGSLQELVQRFQTKWTLAYCAVVGDDGLFVAHSTANQIGIRRVVPTGDLACWGDIQRTRFIAADSRVLREYQVVVHLGTKADGTLLIAVPDFGGWQPVLAAADYAPSVFLAPMLFVVVGATLMRGVARPIARIESMLQAACDQRVARG